MRSRARSERGESGLSMIETIIAFAILLVVVLSILPLFAQSIQQNRQGASFSMAASAARTSLEEYKQLDFNHPRLTVPSGSTSLTAPIEYWDANQKIWTTVDPGSEAAKPWSRQVVVEQFSIYDLLDDDQLDIPLDGDEPIDNVQVKRIQVTVFDNTSIVLGPRPAITLQSARTF